MLVRRWQFWTLEFVGATPRSPGLDGVKQCDVPDLASACGAWRWCIGQWLERVEISQRCERPGGDKCKRQISESAMRNTPKADKRQQSYGFGMSDRDVGDQERKPKPIRLDLRILPENGEQGSEAETWQSGRTGRVKENERRRRTSKRGRIYTIRTATQAGHQTPDASKSRGLL